MFVYERERMGNDLVEHWEVAVGEVQRWGIYIVFTCAQTLSNFFSRSLSLQKQTQISWFRQMYINKCHWTPMHSQASAKWNVRCKGTRHTESTVTIDTEALHCLRFPLRFTAHSSRPTHSCYSQIFWTFSYVYGILARFVVFLITQHDRIIGLRYTPIER